jgi:Carboxypeptidase regulatory-like domain
MKSLVFAFALVLCLCGLSRAQEQPAPVPDAPRPRTAVVVGTVVDANDDTIPGASVVLQSPNLGSPRAVVSNDSGFFQFNRLEPDTYRVTISAQGFANWTSDVIVKPSQYVILRVPKLQIAQALTTINVASAAASPQEIAAEQVKQEERQRIFGIIPNFYVSYNQDAAPLTAKLKFQLAAKVLFDPVTFFGVGLVAAGEQAGNHPNYPQGAEGYGERYGAAYGNGFTDIMIGGAILPTLLHQDPRYFYQGTGTNKSRALHAITSPFVCKGDNGQWQPNYSTVGGDLASAAISNAYYPASNRGVGLFLGNFLIGTGQRAAANLAQEFLLRRLTPKARLKN